MKAKSIQKQRKEGQLLTWLRSKGFRYLFVLDALVLLFSATLITLIRFRTDWPSSSFSHYLITFGLVAVIHLIVFYFGGLYEYEQRLGRPAWLPRATTLSLIAFLVCVFFGFFSNRFLMPRASLVFLFLASSVLISLNRWVSCSLRSRRFGNPRVLLIGSTDQVNLATVHLRESGGDIEIAGSAEPNTPLLEKVDATKATDVLLLNKAVLADLYPNPLEEMEQRRIGVYKQITPSDTLMKLHRSRQIAGMPFVTLQAHALPSHTLRLKRLLDLTYLIIAFPLILSFFLLASVYVRIKVGPNIFYKQIRVGHLNKNFFLCKFRTMELNIEDQTGAQLAATNDSRVIKGMRWLRRTRLDELPQVWNILKGEMSLIGPRPERPEFVETFKDQIPGYERRHDTVPGLTGLAQVQGHYQTDPSYKLGHDLQYIVNWSPILDLQILFKTVLVVLRQLAR